MYIHKRLKYIYLSFIIVSLSFFGGKPALAAQARPSQAPPPFPQLSLPKKAQGSAAIKAFGKNFHAVAAAYGKSTAEFSKIIRRDKTLWFDRKGRTFYIDEVPTAKQLEAISNLAPITTPDLQKSHSAFLLHSKPNSKRTIYLDFDGHLITDTIWNFSYGEPINAEPYNIDNIDGFSNTELSNIVEIWTRVAKDFEAFDVDVTTELLSEERIRRTDVNDEYYGTRAIITHNGFSNCDCAGHAYLGAFNYINEDHDFFQPAIIYYNILGNGYPKYVAETISHEVGHNLNLHHDGDSNVNYYHGHGEGETGWASIMGAGYYKNLTQWSKGEYLNANNKEDDIQIIQNAGLPLRIDDYGNVNNNATTLANTFSNIGVIETSLDVDVFELASGPGLININFFSFLGSDGANLDIKAEIYNSTNQLIFTSNSLDSLGTHIEYLNPTEQTLFLKVSGTGKGNLLSTGYSDYSSIGKYFMTGNFPIIVPPKPQLDTDNDQMDDEWEINHGSNPYIEDQHDDADNDGYTNIEEFRAEENPKLDTDNDGMFDAWEIEHGFDINDSSDCPSWVCKPNIQGGWRSIIYQ